MSRSCVLGPHTLVMTSFYHVPLLTASPYENGMWVLKSRRAFDLGWIQMDSIALQTVGVPHRTWCLTARCSEIVAILVLTSDNFGRALPWSHLPRPFFAPQGHHMASLWPHLGSYGSEKAIRMGDRAASLALFTTCWMFKNVSCPES